MVQFVENGPDIPYEVLEALEEERLVFFCGAGISVPTGLPNFKGLTQEVFEACGVCLAPKKAPDKKAWDTAFHKGEYDRALNHLQNNTPDGTMRRAVMNRLTAELKKDSDLEIHKAILKLSALKKRHGHRLVTTNFDDRFTLAGLDPADCYEAPALPPGRLADWWSAVYLHGRIDRKRDADGHHLILTSRDFGKAYLSDAWATRFVADLFREFVVLFIGYSVEDPVVTYLLDALTGSRPGLRAFALADYHQGSSHREVAERQWRAKGITPITFSTGDNKKRDFSLLRNTLLKWAGDPKYGLEKRAEDALKIGRSTYDKTDENSLNKLAWLLSEKFGAVAKMVAEATPTMHQSWISPLSTFYFEPRPDEERGYHLLAMPSPPPENPREERNKPDRKHHEAPLAGYPRYSEGGLPLHPATFQLGRWIARNHLDKPETVSWVIESHGRLHPRMIELIAHRLGNDKLEPIPEPYHQFWEILTLAPMGMANRNGIWDENVLRGTKEERKAALFRQIVTEAATPFLSVSSTWRIPDGEPPTELSHLARFKVVVHDSDFLKKTIQDERSLLVGIGDLLTAKLIEALHLHALADDRFYLRHSAFDLENLEADSKIYNHQNGGNLLALACLAAFLGAKDSAPENAGRMVAGWITQAQDTGYSILWRLALVAAKEWTGHGADCMARALAGNSGEALWRRDTREEILAFLRKRGKELSPAALEQILSVLDRGPATDHPDWQHIELGDRTRIAGNFKNEARAKLLIGGAALDEETRILAEASLEDNRKRGIADDQGEKRQEIKAEWVKPSTAEALMDMESHEIAEILCNQTESWDAANQVQDLVGRNPGKAIDVLDFLAQSEEQRPDIWTAALNHLPVQLPENDAIKASEFCQRIKTLLETTPTIINVAARGLSDFLAKLAPRLPAGEENHCFWFLWDSAWSAVVEQEPAIENHGIVTVAINHGAGSLAGALLDRLWRRKGKQGSGIPADLMPRFNDIVTKPCKAGHLARVILASRLFWLHWLDPDWCRKNLLPRMAWQDQHGEASGLWQGYLWQPNIGEAFARDIRGSLIDLSRHGMDISKDYQKNLYCVVGEILVGRPKLLTVDHRRKLFAEMPVEGLAYLAYHLRTKLGAAAEKAPILWRKRIKACFDRWPTLLEKNTPRVRQALAEMLLETREAFPETFAFLQEKGLLGQTSEPGAILYRLDRDEQRNAEDSPPYDYIGQHPVEILNLLDVIIPDRPEYWDINDLQKILGRITTAKLGMENSATFVRLQNLTHRG